MHPGLTLHPRQLDEIRVGVLKSGLMPARAGGDQNVGSRNRDPGGSCPPCQVMRAVPDFTVDEKIGEHALELAQHFPLTLAPRTVPKLESHHRTPAGLARFQRPLYPRAHCRFAVGTQQMDP